MSIVRAALVQTDWTGDKESMIVKHEEYAREAAKQGTQVICFQELFYGPYFCQVQDTQFYEYAETVPGPVVERFQALAKELNMVMVLPVYEDAGPGFLYNTAAVLDADDPIAPSSISRFDVWPPSVPQQPYPAEEVLLFRRSATAHRGLSMGHARIDSSIQRPLGPHKGAKSSGTARYARTMLTYTSAARRPGLDAARRTTASPTERRYPSTRAPRLPATPAPTMAPGSSSG